MAGKPIGTIYAELDIDASKYTASQKKILYESQTMAINVENSWKTLGQKSDVIYNAMRQSAVNAFERIKSSSSSSSAEIARAQEAMNAKIKAANEGQFGHQTGLIESLKRNWIAASAAVVAAVALINKAMAYMDEGGKALQIESSFKIMADSAGVNSKRLIEAMKAATRETIDDSDMMQKAVKLMTLGYNPEQIERFSKVVITASQIAGKTAAEAYDELADAIANRMPKALVRMGAVTREQMKIVNEAIKEGASETSLYELAMANLELKQKMLQGTQDSATLALQKFHAEMKGFKEDLGKGLIIVVDAAYRSFEYLASGVLGLVSAYARYRTLVYEIMGDEDKARANRDVATAAWLAREELIKKAGQGILQGGEVGPTATPKEIADAKAKVDAQMKELKAIAGKKEASEAEKKITEALYKQLMELEKLREEAAKETEKYVEVQSDEIVGYFELYDAMGKVIGLQAHYKSELIPIEDIKKQEAETAKLLDDDVQGWIKAIEAKKAAEFKFYTDLADLQRKVNEKNDELKKKQVEANKKYNEMMAEDTADAWKYYYDYITEEQKKTDKLLEDQAKTMESLGANINSIWTSHISSMLKGTESLGEGFKGIFTDMADYAIQQLTRIAMNNLLFGNAAGTYTKGGVGLLASIGSLFGLREGGIMNASFQPFHAYAGGGVASSPTYGVFGEGGPEAFVPLRNGKIPIEGGRGGQPVIYNDNRVTNYMDFVDAEGIERHVVGPVIRGMGQTKHRDAMKNIVRKSL